jgi:fructokinase
VGRGLGSLAYLTVGTGIGGGLIVGGRPIHGAMHPEIGHVRLRRHADDDYPGRCPFHQDCAEGLASGPAIVERFGRQLDELRPDHPFRAILADYLGQLCATLLLVASPERIVIGGGVMAGAGLHDAVEAALRRWLGGYIDVPEADGGAYVVPPALEDPGLAGAFALARDLL